MNKEEIKKKILLEKNANLVDILKIANNFYAKTILNTDKNIEIKFQYYKIDKDRIIELDEEELEEVKNFFETDLGNIVY